ncbi:MAG: 2-dehydropantoate 2-reductase [Opitutaceae bacterium]|jgi:2-dehydropantoate 2-reductase
MNQPIRIAVVGPGAVGLFYSARLAQAGADLSLLLRSDYEAVRARGIGVRSSGPELAIDPSRIHPFSRPEDIGPVDLVLITLKTTANPQFAALIPPLLGPDTAILTLQNGLGSDELLTRQFGAERVLGGISFIASTRVSPGVVECFHPGSITLGEFGRPASERARNIAGWFERAGIPCKVVDNLAEARWRKLVWNVPFNGLSIAAGGITTDKILADPLLASEMRALMDEVAVAARALGFGISERFIQGMIDTTSSLGAYKTSSMIDWQAGREVEVEPIWGEPLRRAAAAGASCPKMALLLSLLRALCSVRAK